MLDIIMAASKRCGELIGGKYVLGDVIGAGGMGVVYGAVQRSLGRRVAIKMPRPDAPVQADVLQRFRTEAFVAGRLWHRNIVAVIDYGDCGGVPFLVMEHVHGVLLGRLLGSHGPLDVDVALDLTSQILDALAESHACGIIHADVKADNVLVESTRSGGLSARLFDFGLAKAHPPDKANDTHLLYGTPEYIAPELIQGQPASPASDVYATGVLLYELLTGSTPFAGGCTQEILSRQLNDDPIAPSRRRGDLFIPAVVESLVMRALAKHPGERFEDAEMFGSEIRRVRSSLARTSQPLAPLLFSTTGPTQRWPQHNLPKRSKGMTLREGRGALGHLHHEAEAANAVGDSDRMVHAYLAIARTLVDQHEPEQAIAELERAVERLTAEVEAGRSTPSLWCVLLTLAALYGHLGDRGRARRLVRSAHEHATRVSSAIGQERAATLLARLERSMAMQKPSSAER
ncbi:MAG: serine/threonine protein kinase [Kofleriaceae bacterium]|nr:serine/threonine protein kinase [Kofleriaceae bacterium]